MNSCHRSRRRKILGTARWSPIKQAVLFPEDCIPKYEGRKTLITCLSWLKQIPGYTRPRRNHHTHHQAHDQLLAKHLLTTPHWSWNKWEQNLTEQDFPTSSAAKKLVQRNMLQPNLFSFSTLWKEGGHSKDAAPGGGGGKTTVLLDLVFWKGWKFSLEKAYGGLYGSVANSKNINDRETRTWFSDGYWQQTTKYSE